MLTVPEAQRLVVQHASLLDAATLSLGPDLLGLVLAEDVASDLDVPPYDKALMDGYAVRARDVTSVPTELQVVEEIAAGHVPKLALRPGQTSRIMTGAQLPEGADAVVMIEKSEMVGDNRVRLHVAAEPEQAVLRRGREMTCNEVVLRKGAMLRPQEIGTLATVGKARIAVVRPPRVAILSTGDEVVEPWETPGPGQIRNSNAHLLAAQVARAGCQPEYLGIARDRLDSLRPLVQKGLQADVLLLTGGVSAGKLDLVPEVLKESQVEPIFHKVAMKPGKPLFFGRKNKTLVFGLPGNPVSAFVGFELFVRPALRHALGYEDPEPTIRLATLTMPWSHKGDRTTYHPARLTCPEDRWQVTPVPWFGSPDLRGLTSANGFVVLESGTRNYAAGERVSVLDPE